MRKRDRKALGAYIGRIADEIGLRDWDLRLLHETCDDDCNAQCAIVYGRKLAYIRVNEDFRGYAPGRIRQTIVHELVHCHFAAADNQVQHDLDDHLGDQTAQVFFNAFRRQMEYGVDAMAAALAPHMPLIDWPKGKKGS